MRKETAIDRGGYPFAALCCGVVAFSLVSLFWVRESQVGPVVLFSLSTLLLLIMVRRNLRRPLEFISPLFLFAVLSFITYPLKLLVFSFWPDALWFVGLHFPVRFNFDTRDFYLTMLVFLTGFLSFVAGYLLDLGHKEASSRHWEFSPSLGLLTALCAFLLLANFFLQFQLGIGRLFSKAAFLLPGVTGIVYYTFSNSQSMLLPMYFYEATKRKDWIHLLVALTMFLGSAGLAVLNLSKAGFVYPALTCTVAFFLVRSKTGEYPRILLTLALLMVLALIVAFPVVALYREIALNQGLGGGPESVTFLAASLRNAPTSITAWAGTALVNFFGRLGGFDIVLPIVAYSKSHPLLNQDSLIHLFQGEKPLNYFDLYRIMMGVPLTNTSGFEISLIGFLFIYLGTLGVGLGMFLWGMFNRYVFGLVRKVHAQSDVLGAGLWPFYLNWFMLTTFGFGPDTESMAIKSFVAGVAVFVFWRNTIFRSTGGPPRSFLRLT